MAINFWIFHQDMSGPLSPGETASNVQDGGTPGLSPVAGHIWIPVRRDLRSYESIVSMYGLRD